MTKEEAMEVLSKIKYPGYSRTLTDFKVVKSVEIKDGTVEVLLNLGTASDGKKKIITDDINRHFEEAGAKARVSTVQESGTTVEQHHYVSGPKKRIAVLSAKGGVGKSTFSVSLAVAMRRKGYEVGIFDADIHGPNVPKMMGIDEKIEAVMGKKLIPHEKGGIHSMSLGYIVDPETPVIWKGSMVTKAIVELLEATDWPEMDFFVVDLPPGTGDAALTIKQNLDVDSAIVVTTPNELSIADARRTISFFRQMGVEVAGFVENMGYMTCDDCGNKLYPFGHVEPEILEEELGVPCLGVLPFDQKVEEAADEGKIVELEDDEYFGILDSIVEKLL